MSLIVNNKEYFSTKELFTLVSIATYDQVAKELLGGSIFKRAFLKNQTCWEFLENSISDSKSFGVVLFDSRYPHWFKIEEVDIDTFHELIGE